MARHSKLAAKKFAKKKPATKADNKATAKKLSGVAARFAAFRPASVVLKRVRSVPTCLVDFDHGTRVGGLPIEYVTLVSGPSNEGKSVAALALVKSFLEADGFVLYGDAERTTPAPWVRQLMGDLLDHPHFFATRPASYEDFIGEVRNFCQNVAAAILAGEVPADTPSLIVVDSLGQLTPKDVLKEILAEFKKEDEEAAKARRFGKAPVTTGKNMMGMRKAAMNSAWLKEMTPQLEKANAALLLIEREYAKRDATQYEKDVGEDFVVQGGGAAFFEGGLVLRITREAWVEQGTGKDRVVYGERHLVTIRKTKVAGKDGRVTLCRFHTSNGTLTPFGFDRARDVLDLGVRLGAVKHAGNSFKFGGKTIGVGEHKAVKNLAADPKLLAEVERATRARFGDHAPEAVDPPEEREHDGDGVVVEPEESLFASTGDM